MSWEWHHRHVNTRRFQVLLRQWPAYWCTDTHGDLGAGEGDHEGEPHLVFTVHHTWLWRRYDPMDPAGTMGLIYHWIWRCGPLEVRRWVSKEESARLAAERVRLGIDRVAF